MDILILELNRVTGELAGRGLADNNRHSQGAHGLQDGSDISYRSVMSNI